MGLKAEEVFSVSKKDDRSIATGFKTAYPNADGSYTVEFVDGTKVKTAPIKGDKGDKGDKFEYEDFTPEELADLKGDQGDKGDKGDKGVGIESITKRGTSGLVDTYLILFADGSETTFDVVNGANITKTSQLENDSNFITNVVKNLLNYYTKDEVYTKANIDELLRNIGAGLSIKIVPELPTEEISGTTIYLIKASGNSYTQYMWIDNDWANLGSTTVDLSNYYTKDKVDEILLGYVTMDAFTEVLLDYVKKEELAKVALSNDYNDLDNLPTIPEVEGIKPYSEVLQDSHNTAPTSKVVYDAVQTLEEEIGEKADADAVPEIDDESTDEDKVWSAKKVNDSLVDKQDFRVFKSLEEFNEKKGTSFTVVSGVDNMNDIANAMSEGDMLIIRVQYTSGSEVYFGLDSSTGWTKMFTLTRIGGLCDIKCTTSAEKNLTRVLAGSTLTAWRELATMDNVGVNDDNPSITYSSADVTITVNKIINGIWYISGYTKRDIRDTDVLTINGYKFAFDGIFYGVDQKTNYYRCWGNKLQTAVVANDSCFGFHLPVVKA